MTSDAQAPAGRVAQRRLRQLPVTFTAREARQAGIAPRDLYGLRNEGVLEELSRGVFRKHDAPATAHLDLIAAAARAPHAVVCLESALALHELIDDVPDRVHLAVPRGSRPPQISWPPVRVSRFNAATFRLGVGQFKASPVETVPVYEPERSVVDAMRLRHDLGESLALHALRTYLARTDANPAAVLAFARQLGVAGPVIRVVEAVLA